MECRTILTLDGNLIDQGFRARLELFLAGQSTPELELFGNLPAQPALAALVDEHWHVRYRQCGIAYRIEPRNIACVSSLVDLQRACKVSARWLRDRFNGWLAAPEFRELEREILAASAPDRHLWLSIRTEDPLAQRLPWSDWHIGNRFATFEWGLSPLNAQSLYPCTRHSPHLSDPVRILAVLGLDRDLNLQGDRQTWSRLPDVQLRTLQQPSRQELFETLWSQPWDILFFGGHGVLRQDAIQIELNDTDVLSLEELGYALNHAAEQGLKIGILNCCEGLSLAEQLSGCNVPFAIAMREAVPDLVAIQFLENFLDAYHRGLSLYQAFGTARRQLQALEAQFPCASWLPVVYQHPYANAPNWPSQKRSSFNLQAFDTSPSQSSKIIAAGSLNASLTLQAENREKLETMPPAALDLTSNHLATNLVTNCQGLNNQVLHHRNMNHLITHYQEIGNQDIDHQKTGSQDTGNQGIDHQKTDSQEIGNQGIDHQKTGSQDTGNQGIDHQGIDHQDTGNQDINNQKIISLSLSASSQAAAFLLDDHHLLDDECATDDVCSLDDECTAQSPTHSSSQTSNPTKADPSQNPNQKQSTNSSQPINRQQDEHHQSLNSRSSDHSSNHSSRKSLRDPSLNSRFLGSSSLGSSFIEPATHALSSSSPPADHPFVSDGRSPIPLPDVPAQPDDHRHHRYVLRSRWRRGWAMVWAIARQWGRAAAVAGGAAAIAIALQSSGWLEPLELHVFDRLTRLHAGPELLDPRIVIVTIDDYDVEYQQQKGWDLGATSLANPVLVQAWSAIEALEPSAVMLDIYRPDGLGLDLTERWAADRRFLSVCKLPDPSSGDPDGVAPPKGVAQTQIGFTDLIPDPDGIGRRWLLGMDQVQQLRPCQSNFNIGVMAAHLYITEQLQVPETLTPDGQWGYGSVIIPTIKNQAGGYSTVDTRGEQILMRYRNRQFREVPLRMLLQPEHRDRTLETLKTNHEHPLVLIGSFVKLPSRGQRDAHATPLKTMPGVVWQAHAIAQLLDVVQSKEPLLRPVPWPARNLWIGSVAIVTVASWVGLRNLRQSLRRSLRQSLRRSQWRWLQVGVGVGWMVVVGCVVIVAWPGGWWLPLMGPWVAIALSLVGMMVRP